MHIPDGFLSPQIPLPACAVSAPPWAWAGDEPLLVETGLAHRHAHRHGTIAHAHFHVHDSEPVVRGARVG